MSRAELNQAVDSIACAEAALCRARRSYPDRGECAVRAVIDVELGNLRRSRQHVLSATALPDPPATPTKERE